MLPRALSPEECAAMLSSGRYGRLGLSHLDRPYVVPMSYVFCDGKIYLHSRGKGRKVEIAAMNPRVCFQIDHLDKNRWSSVLASGTVRLSSDPDAKKRMFEIFMKKGMQGHGGKQFQTADLQKMDMTIWEIEIEAISGREGMW